MKRIMQRLTTTLSANFDSFCNQVENHEAAATSLLQEARRANARLTVQLARLQREREELIKRRDAALEQSRQWKTRALNLRDSDREQAIECLNRCKQQETLLADLTGTLEKQERLIAEVQTAAEQLKAKEEAIRLRKVSLSARETRANVLSRTAQSDDILSGELDSLFDRWEEKVLVNECVTPLTSAPIDTFAAGFEEKERQSSLEAELDALEPEPAEEKKR